MTLKKSERFKKKQRIPDVQGLDDEAIKMLIEERKVWEEAVSIAEPEEDELPDKKKLMDDCIIED